MSTRRQGPNVLTASRVEPRDFAGPELVIPHHRMQVLDTRRKNSGHEEAPENGDDSINRGRATAPTMRTNHICPSQRLLQMMTELRGKTLSNLAHPPTIWKIVRIGAPQGRCVNFDDVFTGWYSDQSECEPQVVMDLRQEISRPWSSLIIHLII
ncbi:hypothetical protein BDR05DRAFT_548934 [Suillus weaverae]|nr:hypothetical protein BDR05DRAFT_548934 [Suillus weaverae]